MKTLQKISEKESVVLNEGQMYACFGGKDTTTGTTYTTTDEETGEVCTYTRTDTYRDGKLYSQCVDFTCESN